MTKQNNSTSTTTKPVTRINEFQRFRRILFSRGLVIFGLVIIVIFILVAVSAPFISPFDPNKIRAGDILAGPSSSHWLGTDSVGRDVLSRIIYGSRVSLLVSIVALILSSSIGMSLGLIAGYFGGVIYIIIMRLVDALMSIPMMLLALTIAALMGGGMTSVIVALGIALVPAYARMMCGQVVSVKQNDYIVSGRSMGASDMRIMLRHVFPNCIAPLIVMMTMQLGTTILAEAGLSFLGIGVQPPTPSWGNLINDGYAYLIKAPLLSFSPGFAIMLVVFSFNIVGDGIRDATDPRLRGVL